MTRDILRPESVTKSGRTPLLWLKKRPKRKRKWKLIKIEENIPGESEIYTSNVPSVRKFFVKFVSIFTNASAYWKH